MDAMAGPTFLRLCPVLLPDYTNRDISVENAAA
jgi:hypothetical protein